jgi:hypothetical protein
MPKRVVFWDCEAATIVHAFGDILRDNSVPVITNCAVKDIERYIQHAGLRDFVLEVWFGRERLKFSNLRLATSTSTSWGLMNN